MKSYPKYKPSGVDWLGEIPSDWYDYKIKFSVNVNQKTLNESTAKDFEFNYVDIESVNGSTIEKTQKLTFANAPSRARRLLQKGDVIVSTVRTYLKAIAQVPDIEGNIVASTGFAVFSPSKILFSDYLKYLAVNDYFIQSVVSRSKGANYPAIAPSELVTIKTPIPPINEQQKIVDFLDYKTGQCDRFIANRQKQIELLNEQKAAIINKAVTKGINPNAKMKPSGIDLIGEIPENWNVWKLKFLTQKIGSGVTPLGGSQVYKTEGVAFFRSQNIYNNRLELSGISFIDKKTHQDMQNSCVEFGDILLNITGASIGRCFFFSGEYPEANVNQHVCIIRSNRKILFNFLHSVMISEIGQHQIFSRQTGTNREGLNFEQLKNFDIPLPPIEEQKSIVNFIKKETSKIETLITKYQKQIDLMQEYRTALISQAVTGKIDVRDWQPKTSSQPK